MKGKLIGKCAACCGVDFLVMVGVLMGGLWEGVDHLMEWCEKGEETAPQIFFTVSLHVTS